MAPTTTTRRPKAKSQRITLTAECFLCGDTKHIVGNRSSWQRWQTGELSSDEAFQRLDPADRLWLVSGICPDH